MEQYEIELIEKHSLTNPELKALRDEHVLFSKQLEKLENKNFLTPAEEQEARALKKQKLDRKTKLVEMLSQYK